MRTVYLAGPILGCTPIEAKTWRDQFSAELAEVGIRGISPLRCEPEVIDRYQGHYDGHIFGTPSAITAKNFFDVKNCDMILAYFPDRPGDAEVSVGTVCEIAWAYALQKPLIVCTQDPFVRKHALIVTQAGWMVDDLDDALAIVTGILNDYGRRFVA